MMTRRPLLWAFLPAILLTQAFLAHAQTVCNAPEAKLGNNFIQIAPNGTDDTDTIQCALDLAVEKNIPEIRLTRGEFFIGPLSARDFVGTLQGGGKDYTRLSLLPGHDCSMMTGFIEFAGGEPRLRWLTVEMKYRFFCSKGLLSSIVHFTGVSSSATSCSYDVIYATIDRVALEGPGYDDIPPWDVDSGILVSPAESENPGCRDGLVGSFKLNRSVVTGFRVGAKIQLLRGGAYIGVYKSSFDGNHTGLYIEDANATVTVSENHFASTGAGTNISCAAVPTAMLVSANSEDVSPGITRLDIHGNFFDVHGRWPCYASGLGLSQESDQTILSPVISNNYFQLTREFFDSLVGSTGVSGGVLNGNRVDVTGHADEIATFHIQNGTNWTVVLNKGFEHTAEQIDIGLGTSTSNILIGPGQGATVKDEGNNNIVLPQ
jgi:hypothetical protein